MRRKGIIVATTAAMLSVLIPVLPAFEQAAPAAQAEEVLEQSIPAPHPSQVKLPNTNPVNNTPGPANGRVEDIAVIGNLVVVGGNFTQVQDRATGQTLDLPYVFAYDSRNGKVWRNFTPKLDGPVYSVHPGENGTSVYLGGAFKTVNGVVRKNLAKVSVFTGVLYNIFDAQLDGRVLDMDQVGGWLYIVGWFSNSRGYSRQGFAALDVAKGRPHLGMDLPLATSYTAGGIRRVNVTPDGTRMVLAGQFDSVAGVQRSQLAMVNLTPKSATVDLNWNTETYDRSCAACANSKIATYIRDVDMDPKGQFIVIGTTWYLPNNGNPLSGLGDALARFEVRGSGANVMPTWYQHSGTDTFTAVHIGRWGVVFAGGHFRWVSSTERGRVLGRVTRWGLVAVDPLNGMPYEWIPTRARGYGVLDIETDTQGNLVIGTDTVVTSGEVHPRLAVFPYAGGSVVPAAPPKSMPVPIVMQNATSMSRGTFDGRYYQIAEATASTAIPGLRAATMVGERFIAAFDDGLWEMVPGKNRAWEKAQRLYLRTLGETTITGLAFQDELLYVTVEGQNSVYAYSMNSDSLLLSHRYTQVAGALFSDAIDFTAITGMFAAGEKLYVGTSDGKLRTLPLPSRGRLNASSPAIQVAGPGVNSTYFNNVFFVGYPLAATAENRPNLALGIPITASSVLETGRDKNLTDGNRDGTWNQWSSFSTDWGYRQYIDLDLGSVRYVSGIRLWPRTDGSHDWLMAPWVFDSAKPFTSPWPGALLKDSRVASTKIYGIPRPGTEVLVGRWVRYIRIQTPGIERRGVQLSELEVLGR